MAKTGLSIWAAVILTVGSLTLFVGRHFTEGSEPGFSPGATSWKVTLVASGELAPQENSVTTVLPPDFRHQHIFDEQFQSKTLIAPRSRKEANKAEATWRRSNPVGTQPFRIAFSFRCLLGVAKPSTAMSHLTRQLDSAPIEGANLKPTPQIESDHAEIFNKARALSGEGLSEVDQVQAFFNFVEKLENEPALGASTALSCLRNESGDSAGKSRLLVALCRNRGIPARVLSGLTLVGDQEQGLHRWAEAWVNNRWLPMCPTSHHFDTRRFPRNYLVLHVGDDEIIRTKSTPVQYGFVVTAIPAYADSVDDPTTTFAQRWWRLFSFAGLRPAEQHLVKFLLLLPLSALIVSVFRIICGVPTFGTFSPALLGLAFLDLQALRWGMAIFVVTVLVGWCLRHLIERFHLLLVPRMAILLSLIVMFLIAVVMSASHFGLAVTQFISLFPIVILTHVVERFWTVEAEDGTAASFKTLVGTMLVAIAVSLMLSHNAVANWMFRHPETLGLVLAVQFVIGRYTGYRISELYRFQDLIQEQPASRSPA